MTTKNQFTLFFTLVFCLLFRLIPFRPPNVEPILATLMPFSRVYGKLSGFLFAAGSIVLYDIVTLKVGIWTLITAIMYGFLGLWAWYFFQNKKNKPWDYAKFAFMSTIIFDLATGLTIGPLFFGQSLIVSFIGQIPFTFWHLVGNVSFSLILSPALYRIITYDHLEKTSLILNPKLLKS